MMHSHVLEHLPGPLVQVLRRMNALIAPGGFHILQVPIHPGWYREDLDPELPGEERTRLFGQDNHMRIFGRRIPPTTSRTSSTASSR